MIQSAGKRQVTTSALQDLYRALVTRMGEMLNARAAASIEVNLLQRSSACVALGCRTADAECWHAAASLSLWF